MRLPSRLLDIINMIGALSLQGNTMSQQPRFTSALTILACACGQSAVLWVQVGDQPFKRDIQALASQQELIRDLFPEEEEFAWSAIS